MPVKGHLFFDLIAYLEAYPTLAVLIAESGLIVFLSTMLAIFYVKTRSAMQAKARLDVALADLALTSEREVMMRMIAEHASDGLVFHDVNGQILWANAAYCQSMGYTLEELIGRHPQDFRQPVGLAITDDAPTDLPCRIGGDEFVVAVPGVTDFHTLHLIADAVMERVCTPITWNGAVLDCRASIGIALNANAYSTAEEMVRTADFALYKAKAPGGPSIARYDADLHRRQASDTTLFEEFAAALDAGAADFLYQPIIHARTHQIHSVEALARWPRSNGKVVLPDTFLPFAARMGAHGRYRLCGDGGNRLSGGGVGARGTPHQGGFKRVAGHPCASGVSGEFAGRGRNPRAGTGQVHD